MTHLYRDRVSREQIATVVHDVRHAWRVWRRTPILALAAITSATGDPP